MDPAFVEDDDELSVTLHLNYTIKSHVMTGDFKERYADFRETFLNPTPWIRYGKYRVGKGWVISQKRLGELKEALDEHGVLYNEAECVYLS